MFFQNASHTKEKTDNDDEEEEINFFKINIKLLQKHWQKHSENNHLTDYAEDVESKRKEALDPRSLFNKMLERLNAADNKTLKIIDWKLKNEFLYLNNSLQEAIIYLFKFVEKSRTDTVWKIGKVSFSKIYPDCKEKVFDELSIESKYYLFFNTLENLYEMDVILLFKCLKQKLDEEQHKSNSHADNDVIVSLVNEWIQEGLFNEKDLQQLKQQGIYYDNSKLWGFLPKHSLFLKKLCFFKALLSGLVNG